MMLVRTNIRSEDGTLLQKQHLGFVLPGRIPNTDWYNVVTVETPFIRLALRETEFNIILDREETKILLSIPGRFSKKDSIF
jgi:hypothetical protein